MAVSFAQLHVPNEAIGRRRAASTGTYQTTNTNTNKMAYYQADAMYMPMPEHFHHQQQPQYFPPPPPLPPPQHYGTYGYPPAAPHYDPFAPPPEAPQYPYQPPPQYSHSNDDQIPPPPPPRPPKTPIEEPNPDDMRLKPPKPGRPHSYSQPPPSTFSHMTIQPDPLPPHTNPQALTPSQSAAFQGPQPIPPVRLGRDTISNAQSGSPMFTITREAAHMPSFLSSKPYLTIARLNPNLPTIPPITIASIKFHTMLSSNIDFTLSASNRTTSISHSGCFHSYWSFQSTTLPNEKGEWFWKKDKISGGAKLEDAKKNGQVLAKMKGDLLTFETARLSKESYEEVLVSAVAMAEAARRQRKGMEIVDLAAAVGDFAASAGGADGGGGGGDGGGGGGGGGA